MNGSRSDLPGRRTTDQVRFSGWSILAVASIANFLSGPAQTYGVSVFVDPLLAEFGWSRSLFSTAYSAGTLASAGALVLAGRLIDQRGSRFVLILAAAGFVLALLLLSMTNGFLAVLLGFAMLRTFGSGVLTLSARTLIPNWFRSRTGRAFSILAVAGMVSQATFPAFNSWLIGVAGWRGAWQINAAIVAAILIPLVVFVVRDRPEQVGQHPDGRPPATQAGETSEDERAFTSSEALRTGAFWRLIGASVVPSLVVTGMSFNQVAMLTEQGLPRGLAATTFTIDAAVALLVSLAAGWLVDRFPVRYVLAAGQVCLAISMVFLLTANSILPAVLFAVWRGASSGLWIVAADVAWPAYFGRRYLGSIRGIGFSVGVVGAALGPVIFGAGYDLAGGYGPVIAALISLPVIATIAVVTVRPPHLASTSAPVA